VTLHPSDIDLQRVAFEPVEHASDRINRHVDGCERCGAIVRYLRALRSALRRAEAASRPIPHAAIERLLRDLGDERSR
jgi:hypothetical protein